MEYKISEIVKELKESTPEDIRQANKPAFNAGNIHSFFEEKGLLYSDVGGRRPTEFGKSRGITEELRTGSDGRDYWQVLYSEEARDMARAIIFSKYPDVDPDRTVSFSHMVGAAFDGRGINASRRIAEEYPGYIIIMFCGTDYRAFEDSAHNLSDQLDLKLFENARGIDSVIMKEDVLKEMVIPFLMNGDKSFIVNMEDEMHIYSAVRKPVAPIVTARPAVGREIRFGLCAEIESEHAWSETVFLATREHSKTIVIHHGNGTEEIISVPITSMKGIRILSPQTALSRALIGSRENTYITCDGEKFFIRRVFRSDVVNDQTIR